MPWDALRYVQYARRYGWTPRQVDQEVPLHLDRLIFRVDAAIDEEIGRRRQANND